MKSKLAPRYIGTFEVIERIGFIAYLMELPPYLRWVYGVFYVSLLWKTELDLARVLLQVPKEIQEDLIIKVWPVRILDRNVKELRNKKVLLMKALWKSFQIEEKTWE